MAEVLLEEALLINDPVHHLVDLSERIDVEALALDVLLEAICILTALQLDTVNRESIGECHHRLVGPETPVEWGASDR